jgi:hypothetical protein
MALMGRSYTDFGSTCLSGKHGVVGLGRHIGIIGHGVRSRM